MNHFLVNVLPWEQRVWIVPPEQLSLSQYVRYRWWKARTFRSSLKLSRPQWYGFLSHEGRWVSMLEIVHRPAKVGVEDVRLGLVGAVATLPQARGKGYASVLLRESVGFIGDRLKCDFAWLMCAEDLVPFYERLGWQRVQGPFYFHQPGGRVQGELAAMAFACQGRPWPEGELDLCGLPL